MLRRAASLLGGRAAWRRRLPRLSVTSAAGLARHHPEACARLRPLAPIPHLGAVGARGYVRMARRIPPARPDGYSTSDGEAEADAHGDDEDLELGAGADGEEGPAEAKEWEGYMLDFGSGSDEDDEDEDDDASEEGEKK